MTEKPSKKKSNGAARASVHRKSAAESTPESTSMAKSGVKATPAIAKSASRRIDGRIQSLQDWRGEMLAQVRRMIHEADPDITEDCKWIKPSNPMGVPVWSHDGIVCTGEAYKQVVKLTFARGAALRDPRGLFNSSLEGATRRAIDLREGEVLDAKAFKALIREAVAINLRSRAGKPESLVKRSAKAGPKAATSSAKSVKLLSGGNPQIAKGDGEEPIQQYIAAMPGWKRDLGKRLDELVVRNVPAVIKAVKWNSPFYGVAGQGWFLSFHCYTKYIKVAFFRGAALQPVPPGQSKSKEVRYLDIREGDAIDEQQFSSWVKQAAGLPGWVP